jgi:hypothetical protein
VLAYCQELARQLVAALRDLETLEPDEMQGLLAVVGAAQPAVLRDGGQAAGNGRHAENGKQNGRHAENGKHSENGRARKTE